MKIRFSILFSLVVLFFGYSCFAENKAQVATNYLLLFTGCINADDNNEYNAPQCADGIDNDSDGLIDSNDPGCSGTTDDNEADDPAVTSACEDGLDNDGDGLIDLADPGCISATDNDEYNAPQCADGLDNDSDGLTDLNDPGCTSTSDEDESDDPIVTSACEDGIDNDSDGLIDLADPGCSNASDNDEYNAPESGDELCAGLSVLQCENLSNIPTGIIPDDTSFGNINFNIDKGSCQKMATGGVDWAGVTDHGCVRMTYPEGDVEDNMAMSSNIVFSEPDQINVGIIVRFSANALRAHNPEVEELDSKGEWKFIAVHTVDYSPDGGRPCLFFLDIIDSRSDKNTAQNSNYDGIRRYWIPVMAQDANGMGSVDEAGNTGRGNMQSWYNSGNVHGFCANDYVGENVYIEIELHRSPGNNYVYVYTQDGLYRGAAYPDNPAGTPLISSPSLTTAPRGNYENVRMHEWIEGFTGTDSGSIIEFSGFKVDNQFMGPPEGFIN
jgi:hypothetical protein